MKTKDLIRELRRLLSVPEPSKTWERVMFLFLGNPTHREKERLGNAILLSTALEFIWEGFEEALAETGIDLSGEVNPEIIDKLVDVSDRFFVDVQKDGLMIRAKEHEAILMAIARIPSFS